VSWRVRESPVRQAVVRYVVSGLVAVVLISALGVWLFSRAGEAEALRDAKDPDANRRGRPAVSDALLRASPKAISAIDRVVQERVLSDDSIARVKIWDAKPENRFERQFGRLFEVYLPIETPSGRQLRYEIQQRGQDDHVNLVVRGDDIGPRGQGPFVRWF
jgi:hypothetical protein